MDIIYFFFFWKSHYKQAVTTCIRFVKIVYNKKLYLTQSNNISGLTSIFNKLHSNVTNKF